MDPDETTDLLHELLLAGPARRAELNDLLRREPALRPRVARLLVEDAALTAALRLETVQKWAQVLHPRPVEMPAARTRRFPWRVVAAAAACLTAAILIFSRGREAAAHAGDPLPAARPIGVARALDGEGRAAAASELLRAGNYETGAGRVRLDLDNGVVLSVTGPARIELGLAGCRLLLGQLGVEVPADVDTYIVETESGRFVDLGTTFSVSVQPGRPTEMAVKEGMVRAERISYEGDVVSRLLVHEKEGVVFEGPAARIRTVRAGELGHPSPIPPTEASLAVPRAYRDAVAASSPLLAWDFEAKVDDATFSDRASGRFSARVRGRVITRDDAASGNRYLVFGTGDGWIESPETWHKPHDAPFTIELWVRPDRTQWGHLLNLSADGQTDPVTGHEPRGPLSHFALEFTHTRVFETMSPEPSVRAAFRTPATEHPTRTLPGGVNAELASPERYVPGKWYHLAARMDGAEFVLFIDGEAVSRKPVRLTKPASLALGLRLGALRHRESGSRQFAGAIDEVAIYERALSDSEIRAHFRTMNAVSP